MNLEGRVFHADIEMQIVARDKQVILLFSRVSSDSGGMVPALTDNLSMSAESGLFASQVLADMAYEIDSGLKMPNAQKLALIEKHRAVLIPRMTVMLNSLRENRGVSNEQLATQFMDTFAQQAFN